MDVLYRYRDQQESLLEWTRVNQKINQIQRDYFGLTHRWYHPKRYVERK